MFAYIQKRPSPRRNLRRPEALRRNTFNFWTTMYNVFLSVQNKIISLSTQTDQWPSPQEVVDQDMREAAQRALEQARLAPAREEARLLSILLVLICSYLVYLVYRYLVMRFLGWEVPIWPRFPRFDPSADGREHDIPGFFLWAACAVGFSFLFSYFLIP